MTSNDNHDLRHFLPSYWATSLANVPLLCSKFETIELDEKFIEFIESDGLILEEENTYVSALSSCDELSESDSDHSVSYYVPSEKFPEVHENIKNAIKTLGGVVVPKINWTVPKVDIIL